MEQKAHKPLIGLTEALKMGRWRGSTPNYNTYNIIPPQDADLQKYTKLLDELFEGESVKDVDYVKYFELPSIKHARGIASLLGLGIADALGASTEFIPFVKNRHHLIQRGFLQIPGKITKDILHHRGQVGIWTDDCSMSLCLADSILATNFQFDPIDLRYRFMLWLDYGLNNGGRPYSIGLGGNISISMSQFQRNQTEYCEEGQRFNNGNGSIMRLGPSAIGYHDDLQKGMEVSGKQSRTTHNGDEAKECSRLLARIIIKLINRDQKADPKQCLVEACESFTTSGPHAKSVEYLAKSQQQPYSMYEEMSKQNPKFIRFNKNWETDRNWQWKNKEWTYSETRAKQQPGYIGSYCMDGMCMALHIAYHTSSFLEAALWAVNMGGDCDTVGAVVGQITGSMYGLDRQMLRLYSEMVDSKTHRYHLFLKGYKLVSKKGVQAGSYKENLSTVESSNKSESSSQKEQQDEVQ